MLANVSRTKEFFKSDIFRQLITTQQWKENRQLNKQSIKKWAEEWKGHFSKVDIWMAVGTEKVLSITNDQGREMLNQPARSDHITHRMALLRKMRGKCWWGCAEKGNPCMSLAEAVSWCSHYGKWYGVSLKNKTKMRREPPYNPAIQLSGYISKGSENQILKMCILTSSV